MRRMTDLSFSALSVNNILRVRQEKPDVVAISEVVTQRLRLGYAENELVHTKCCPNYVWRQKCEELSLMATLKDGAKSPLWEQQDAMNQTNGDKREHFWAVSSKVFMVLQSVVRMKDNRRGCVKNEKRSRERTSVPVYFLTFIYLDSHCVKWTCLSDCQFWKVIKIVWCGFPKSNKLNRVAVPHTFWLK